MSYKLCLNLRVITVFKPIIVNMSNNNNNGGITYNSVCDLKGKNAISYGICTLCI